MPHNMKPREVWCPHCYEYTITDELEPICPKCRSNLFTVLYSPLTGKRLTGHELAK
jgi:Zn finger protein HypA/HybF involved in hydrogenase expression